MRNDAFDGPVIKNEIPTANKIRKTNSSELVRVAVPSKSIRDDRKRCSSPQENDEIEYLPGVFLFPQVTHHSGIVRGVGIVTRELKAKRSLRSFGGNCFSSTKDATQEGSSLIFLARLKNSLLPSSCFIIVLL